MASYSDEELEVQYNNQRRVPEHPRILEDWTARSARLREQTDCRADLAYGDGPRERLDLFRCADQEAALLVYIHGGYWQRGDKSMYGFVANGPLGLGMHVAVINYGLCPQVRFETIAPQTGRAVAWLWHNANRLGVDRDRLLVAGHSAGGHLAAMLAATDFQATDPALPRCPLRGVLAISGVFDVAPLVPTTINEALSLDEHRARAQSPLLREPVARCPLVAAVGGDESEEFKRQARDLAERWSATMPTRDLELAGRNHFTVLESLADADGALTRALAMLEQGALP